MSNATITPAMRVAGWNVVFYVGRSPQKLAGLYQVPESTLVTFRDVVDELRLCFDFNFEESGDGNDADSECDPWDDVAFAMMGRPGASGSAGSLPTLVQKLDRSQPVPSLYNRSPKQPNITRYHLVSHKACFLPPHEPLAEHLRAKCAKELPHPTRRCDPRYLPPKKSPTDTRYAAMPLRKKARGRWASSPPKRPVSGSASPTRDGDNQDVNGMIAPAGMDIDQDRAKEVMDTFRHNCGLRTSCCAVSGEGDSWVVSPTMGLALQACHIVPQNHYHTYPIVQNDDGEGYSDIADSPRHLQDAWLATWSADNGILLMSHLHEAFDARLFSIHPETHLIRSFVPYNVITKYNGQQAIVPENVDQAALRHHYDMCCIENMAASAPLLEVTITTTTPLSAATSLLATPGSANGSRPDSGRVGDPSKRSRPTPGQGQRPIDSKHDNAPDQEAVVLGLDPESEEAHLPVSKRRRMDQCEVGDMDIRSPQHWVQYDDGLDSYITPLNSREFLADVNWELYKFRNRAPWNKTS
ncbi:hypothetical protein F66182_8527 [Fusarium sp. NRRL 66182]|nr:hypothetical protein F66182_8527 [Fusarium sp. NRRL 66182]